MIFDCGLLIDRSGLLIVDYMIFDPRSKLKLKPKLKLELRISLRFSFSFGFSFSCSLLELGECLGNSTHHLIINMQMCHHPNGLFPERNGLDVVFYEVIEK